jgi:hypothetical protein
MIIDSETQMSDMQSKEAEYANEILNISIKNDYLTSSLEKTTRLLQEVTDERDRIKLSLGSDLKSAQVELEYIKKERDSLSSFLKSTADSTIFFSKLLSQISRGIMSKYLI